MISASKRPPSPFAGVNARSRLAGFTIALLVWAIPVFAQAERVVLYPLNGDADQARLDEVEQQVADILREQGHTIVTPPSADRPTASAQMESVATATNAVYVVVGRVDPLPGQYRFEVHVYYHPAGRIEDLVATVLESEEHARLSDILSSMVRRQGLGDDALRLTGQETPPDQTQQQQGETDEERQQREAQEQAQRDAEAQAQREAEEAARREAEAQAQREAQEAAQREQAAQDAWNQRPRYGSDGHWMIQLGGGGRYAAAFSSLPGPPMSNHQAGGGLFDATLRIGRTFDGLDGFELRGGLDFTTGVFTALGLHVGAAWLGSFFVEPVYIGVGGDVGVIFPFTGARDPGFSARVGALFAWRPFEHFYLEASLPEIGVLTPGTGAFTIGASLRVGYRFN